MSAWTLTCWSEPRPPEPIGSFPPSSLVPAGLTSFASERKGKPVALRFAASGYRAFVLRYTTRFRNREEYEAAMAEPREVRERPGEDEEPVLTRALYDLAKALPLLRENAERWQVDPDKIAVCGFSAGGHLAASLGVRWQEESWQETFKQDGARLKPNALILGCSPTDFTIRDFEGTSNESYARLRELAHRAIFGTAKSSLEQLERHSPAKAVTSDAPPAFVWHTADDRIANVGHALAFSSAMARRGEASLSSCMYSRAGATGCLYATKRPPPMKGKSVRNAA